MANPPFTPRIEPVHIGDGVYAHDDGHHLVLTTGDHRPGFAANVILLDDAVRARLRTLLDTFDAPPPPKGA